MDAVFLYVLWITKEIYGLPLSLEFYDLPVVHKNSSCPEEIGDDPGPANGVLSARAYTVAHG